MQLGSFDGSGPFTGNIVKFSTDRQATSLGRGASIDEPTIVYSIATVKYGQSKPILGYSLAISLNSPRIWNSSCRLTDDHATLTQRLNDLYNYEPISRFVIQQDSAGYQSHIASESHLLGHVRPSLYRDMCLEIIDSSYEGYKAFTPDSKEMQALPLDLVVLQYRRCDLNIARTHW